MAAVVDESFPDCVDCVSVFVVVPFGEATVAFSNSFFCLRFVVAVSVLLLQI